MATVKVRNVGPFDRDIKSIGAIVKAGETVEVSAAVAGEAPGPWLPAAGVADDGQQYRASEKPTEKHPFEVRNPGFGLLAQEDIWVPVKASEVKAAAAEKVEG